MTAETFGDRVRRLREEKRMTLRRLAQLCSVTPSFFSDVEHGRRFPSDHVLGELARHLGVSVDVLEETRLTRATTDWIEKNPELVRLLIEARRKPLILRRLLRARRDS